MRKLLKLGLASGMMLALTGTPVLSLENFGDWDSDGSPGISDREFRTGFENSGAYGRWDANDDRVLSAEECEAGVAADRQRFEDRFGSAAFCNEWDVDANAEISEDEFYDGSFGAYDADDNNVIEEPEFGDLGDDIGDGGLWDV